MNRHSSMTTSTPTTTRRDLLLGAGALSLLSSAASLADATTSPPLPTGDVHDFDFLYGNWTGTNRRLKQRWVGSDDWDTFPGSVSCAGHLGGVVNVDEVVFPTKGWSGVTLRTFSIAKRQWSLYWINSKTGELFPPVVGGFSGDTGLFYGDDTDEGQPIKVVFKWTRVNPDCARWEQAFSLDGKVWETNWFVEHRRVKG